MAPEAPLRQLASGGLEAQVESDATEVERLLEHA